LQILDEVSVTIDDEPTAAASLLEEDCKRAGNLTSESVEKSGDIPDRGTTLVPFSVRLGDEHPLPLSPSRSAIRDKNMLKITISI